MHPRPWNRAERRAVVFPYWLDFSRSCRHRQHAHRLAKQRARRGLGESRRRAARHGSGYGDPGRNVWRG